MLMIFQVTEEVNRLLQNDYDLVCRGNVSVKGKGQMMTYFLEGKVQDPGKRAPHHTSGLECRVHAIARSSNTHTKAGSTTSMASGFVARIGMSSSAQGSQSAAANVPTLGEEQEVKGGEM